MNSISSILNKRLLGRVEGGWNFLNGDIWYQRKQPSALFFANMDIM